MQSRYSDTSNYFVRNAYAYQIPTNPQVLEICTVTCNDVVLPYSRYEDMIYLNGYGSNSTVIMDYIFRQDESNFPPYFRLALEYKLASIYAGAVARDAGMIKQFDDLAERQFMRAKNIASQETTSLPKLEGRAAKKGERRVPEFAKNASPIQNRNKGPAHLTCIFAETFVALWN